MKKSRVAVIFDRKNQVAKKGKGFVEVRIYLNHNERKFISLDEITPDEWEGYSDLPSVKQSVSHYESILQAMETIGTSLTIENLNKALGLEPQPERKASSKASVPDNFIAFMYDQLQAERIGRRTTQAREVVYRTVLAFGKIKKFSDLTPANILDYDRFIREGGERTDVTVKSYHKRLHRYVLKAFEYGYIDRDPYKAVTIPTGRSAERRPLSEEEIKKLRSLQLRGKEEKARDLFIFSCFTGLCYCDTQAYDYGTMTEKLGDYYYIDGSRIKTGTNFFTPILPPAMEVLSLYNYKLPRLSNQKYNDYLHLIESKLKLNKPLTTHLARHTFATLVLSQGVPIENLARMLGHKDVRTTQLYAKILKKTIQRYSEGLNSYFQ